MPGLRRYLLVILFFSAFAQAEYVFEHQQVFTEIDEEQGNFHLELLSWEGYPLASAELVILDSLGNELFRQDIISHRHSFWLEPGQYRFLVMAPLLGESIDAEVHVGWERLRVRLRSR
jgi:hypothetical protein